MTRDEVVDSEGLSQFVLDEAAPVRFGQLRYPEALKDNLVCFNEKVWLHKNAALAYIEMTSAMRKDGCAPVVVNNGFCSYERQEKVFDYYRLKKEYGTKKAISRVALPGHSEHHTGFAMDIRLPKGSLVKLTRSASYAWLKKNAHKFGFYETYGKNNIFGTVFEPWHWCFSGCPESRRLFASRSLLFQEVDSSDERLLSIIRDGDPFVGCRNELKRDYPEVYAILLSHKMHE